MEDRKKLENDSVIYRPEVELLFDKNAQKNLSFVDYVKFMKDKEILDQVLKKIVEIKDSLK